MPLAFAWALMAASSAALTMLFSAAAIPAPFLLGPMLGGLGFALSGRRLRVPRPLFTVAQGVVGCLIASAVSPEVVLGLVKDWPALLFGAAYMVAASGCIGWAVARYGTLPGPTAAWGSSPGAASAMVSMAGEFGADVRLVATMQYVRVVGVAVTASLVTSLLVRLAPEAPPSPLAIPDWDMGWLAATLAVAILGAWLGRLARVPAGGLLVPLAIGIALNATGLGRLILPSWLLVCAYATIGWYIGLQFTRDSVSTSVRALPEIVLAAAAIIVLCGFEAWLLVLWLGLTPITAFLATSPGGIDTVAILAASGQADAGFVMALQTLRLLAVVALGPAIARWIARTPRRT